MNTETPKAPKPGETHKIKPAHQDDGGGKWKWLAGAAVAAVLVGVGYVAMTGDNNAPNNEVAYTDTINDTDARYAAPSPADEPIAAPEAVDSTASDRPASTSNRSAAAPRSTRTQTAAAAQPVVIEQTIGVDENGGVAQNASYAEDETVVVQGRRVLRPVWARTPSDYRLASAYPERMLERGREGEAQVACTVLVTGRLDCAQTSQSAPGFGAAAVRVAQSFRHQERRADGELAAGTPVNFRVLFRIEDSRRPA